MKKIEGTTKTPEVIFDFENGALSISGISISENPQAFYLQVFQEIDEYLKNPKDSTTINLDLEYFNSSSAIMIRDIIRKFEYHSTGPNCVVRWIHDSDDHGIRNSGLEFQNIFEGIKFEIVGLDRD